MGQGKTLKDWRNYMKTQATAEAGVFPLEETKKNPIYQAYQILHWGFVVAPILAGIDKFFMKLTDWTQYLWAPLGNLVGGPHLFMQIVGAIEIVAGFLVLFKPNIGGVYGARCVFVIFF